MTLFFYGPNSYALRQQLRQMVEAYRGKAGSDFGLERIDGAVAKPQELMAGLQAAPFLASSRLVIVEGAAGGKAADKLPGLLGKVPETTVAVFVEREVDKRTLAFKALSKADKVVKFEALEGPKLLAWANAEVARLGGSAEPGAVRELVGRVGEDQWRLSAEINKLVNYSAVVTRESVDAMVSASLERSIFDLVEAMTGGRTGEALKSYRIITAAKESEMYVLTMVQWQLRNLLLAKSAPGGMSADELAAAAGMSGFVAGKMHAAARGLETEALKSAYEAAADCEFDIKSGRLKASEAVERLIYEVATGVR